MTRIKKGTTRWELLSILRDAYVSISKLDKKGIDARELRVLRRASHNLYCMRCRTRADFTNNQKDIQFWREQMC